MSEETQNTPQTGIKMLDVEPRFVLEVASGVRDPAEVAAEFGYSTPQWEQLKEYAPFKALIEAKKAELKANGYTFRMKTAFIAEELLKDLYAKATEEGASFHTSLELAKFAAKASGLDSPPEKETSSGSQFSISINLGGETVQIGVNKSRNQQKFVENEPESTFIDHETFDIPHDSTTFFRPYAALPL